MRRLVIALLCVSVVTNLVLGAFLLRDHGFAGTNPLPDVELVVQIEQMEAAITALEQQRDDLLNRLRSDSEPVVTVPSAPVQEPAPDQTIYDWYFVRSKEHRPPATDTRYVSMLDGRGFYLGPATQKEIYLTFDAGYENGYTARILDTLRDNGVQAAFFVTGGYVQLNQELVLRMAREGHTIGNHSMNHPSMPTLDNNQVRSEIDTVHQLVKNLTGKEMKHFRPPYGQFNGRVLELASQQGYTTVFWSMAYRDWDVDNQPGAEATYRHVMDYVHEGAVILLHNVSSSNAEALARIIKDLKAQGYRFASLEDVK